MTQLALPSTLIEQLRRSHWRILVTGASGWLGQATLELLSNTLGSRWHTRVSAFGSQARTWSLRDGTIVSQRPLTELPALPHSPSLLLHFAYLTREKASTMSADAYINTNRMLSRLAAEGGASVGVERVFVTSSGAVNAAMAKPDDEDPNLFYGRLKLEDEALFKTFVQAAPERRTFIARLFNLSGPYINKLNSYALASFIRQARQGRIQIHARHPVVRSYTSAANLLGVAMGQLLTTEADPFLCVETTGECEVEVGDLAQMVREFVAPDAAIARLPMLAEPADRYVGDGARYRQLLALHGIDEHPLARQINDTADFIAQIESGSV